MDTDPTSPLIQTGSVHTINWIKVLIVVVGLAVFGGICAYAGYEIPVRQNYTPVLSNASTTKGNVTPSVTASTMVSPTISPTPSVLPTPYSYPGWKTYTDSQDQVSFAYPSDYQLSVDTNNAPMAFDNSNLQYQSRIDFESTDPNIQDSTFIYKVSSLNSIQTYLSTLIGDEEGKVEESSQKTINGRSYTFDMIQSQLSSDTSDLYIFNSSNNQVIVLSFMGPFPSNIEEQVVNSINF